ncbi:hypothetical protein TPASS_0699 [Treponema pallidum subsp. pallidum SS14]|uniref:Uncharacterized protein TP_0699 n=2 Tax=Treponema pallidum subsp. pallidum TaxID=161 RepID=Y699_TREPA|nr:RecName: Full=Uncharacterized protein TP_0699 [Treponema pallidum subsp. pallidum str. Nichols]AAC65668.1 predicted coding region TP0699 [Treponema pallidum subsp. pallidum str. Nichols]ACD71117.1 hypothetical protein TPASS_0699 [Treponema pallidum subsp. pallidum SS14]
MQAEVLDFFEDRGETPPGRSSEAGYGLFWRVGVVWV